VFLLLPPCTTYTITLHPPRIQLGNGIINILRLFNHITYYERVVEKQDVIVVFLCFTAAVSDGTHTTYR
jgi:hypothetical protein